MRVRGNCVFDIIEHKQPVSKLLAKSLQDIGFSKYKDWDVFLMPEMKVSIFYKGQI